MRLYEEIASHKLFSYDKYFAKDLLASCTYPWEILPQIAKFITSFSLTLNKDEYTLCEGADGKYNVWIANSVKVDSSAKIYGPTIIDHNTEIRPSAFIRGNAIIGKNCVIGNSTEIKNSVILDNAQLPHYNYVGDSIIGNYSHLGAGAITSNLKSTKTTVYINQEICTNLRKVGAFVGDNVEVGCNSVLNPGTIIGKNSIVYPVSCLRGVFPDNSIIKTEINIITRRKNI